MLELFYSLLVGFVKWGKHGQHQWHKSLNGKVQHWVERDLTAYSHSLVAWNVLIHWVWGKLRVDAYLEMQCINPPMPHVSLSLNSGIFDMFLQFTKSLTLVCNWCWQDHRQQDPKADHWVFIRFSENWNGSWQPTR